MCINLTTNSIASWWILRYVSMFQVCNLVTFVIGSEKWDHFMLNVIFCQGLFQGEGGRGSIGCFST